MIFKYFAASAIEDRIITEYYTVVLFSEIKCVLFGQSFQSDAALSSLVSFHIKYKLEVFWKGFLF